MKRLAIAVAAVVAAALPGSASAQQVEYKVTVQAEAVRGTPNDHYLTFSGPVQIPEVTLAAGSYVFSVVGPSIVHVTSVDRSVHYAMFFTAPTERVETTSDYLMTIASSTAGSPGRITKWFLPDREQGFEFLYPEARGDR